MNNALPTDQAARDRIHEDLDATLFVEAGAGTGKTRELIERLVRLVTSGRTELRRIAAITFTDAAAADLRDRVRTKLEEAARDETDLSADERARCRAALSELDAAAIETLHGFAQRILTAHPLEAGLPPLIEIQDDIRASIAFDERWAAFLDELLADRSLEDVLLRAFSLGLEVGHLREVAWEFHEHWDRLQDWSIVPAPLAPLDVSGLLQLLEQACDWLPNCLDSSDLLCRHLQRVDGYRRRLAAAADDLETLQVLSEDGPIKLGRGGQAPNWHSVTPGHVRDLLAVAQDARDALLVDTRAALLPPLIASLRGFILQYAEERRRQGRLEFHDLLVQARALLRSDASVRQAVRERFSHLLIDEFQDTDPLQIDIAALVAGDGVEAPPSSWRDAHVEEGRLFFVGDPKQSIYRFRRADIELYQEVQSHFAQEAVQLTQNFRSRNAVIDWVNDTFAHLMDAAQGQATYIALQPASQRSDGEAVTVHTLGGPLDANIAVIREREAAEIARAIRAAKAQRWQVSTTNAAGRQAVRDAHFADIAILMPTRTALPPIEEALEAAGIPYRVESRSLVYDTQEVRDLLAILRALDDPTDQVALIAALRSPAFGCSDEDLLRFSRARGGWDYRRPRPASLPDDDPVVAAMQALADLHRRRWWETISGVVEAVIRERRLFELAFAHRRPRERWQRLRFVLDQARAFAEAGGRTLRQFIDWAERQAEQDTRVVETVVPEPDDDAVRIMTIHAAKGLEFPIVVLAGLNIETTSRGRQRAPVLWQPGGGPETRFGSQARRFETPGYDALAQHEKRMDEQEKIRLLYVAATRARDHLIVSMHHKRDGQSHGAELYARSAEAPHLSRPAALPELPTEPEAPRTAFADHPEWRDEWLAARRQQVAALSRVPHRSATEIAHRVSGASDDPNIEKDEPVEDVPPWRRGRAGTAFGRAVHAVLQSIDLAGGAGLEGAARAQAAAEGITGRAADVAGAVRAALAAPSVREAVAGGSRYWRELYVSGPVDGAVIEGFVDLLYESPDGLVVVDYKTDSVAGEEELEAAVARYRLQGAAYALALEAALGQPIARCVFVFAQATGARERDIIDLPAAIQAVRDELRRDHAADAGARDV